MGRGTTLGRYVILRCLGSGGMGIVYAAYDAELDRRVALKVLRRDLAASHKAATRLLREARALAKLSHPNVVAVFDAGTHDGRVYVAMEFIAGVTFAEWLAVPRTRKEILARFLEAGRGLAAVHRAGLVHRDVKPSNLMLGEDGRVRVVDFGLAQPSLSGSGPGMTEGLVPGGNPAPRHPLTRTAGVAGTPAFMAPEQRRGRPADARGDQFAFCASLFYALYGRLPSAEAAEAAEAVPRSAARQTLQSVLEAEGGRVPGWLYKVVQRGLESDPAARHDSMDALLAALERDPAIARRRFFGAVAALAFATTGLAALLHQPAADERLCGGAAALLQEVWSAPHKAALRQNAELLAPPLTVPLWQRAEERLDRYAESWAGMHREACEATRVRGEQSERLLDLRMACLDERRAEMRAVIGVLSTADTALMDRAVELVNGLSSLAPCADLDSLVNLEPLPEDAAVRRHIEGIRARVARGKALIDAARYADARTVLEAAVAAARETGYRPLEANALRRLGELHGREGRLDRMERYLYEALTAAQAGRATREVAAVWSDLVIVAWFGGRWEQADRWGRLAAAAIEAIGGDDELSGRLENRLGMTHNRQELYAEAIVHFERSRALLGRVLGSDHPRAANPLFNMGIALEHLGRRQQALAAYRGASEIYAAAYGDKHPNLATPLGNIALIHLRLGEPRAALEHFERALALRRQVLPAEHPDIAGALYGIGRALIDLGQPRRAVAPLEEALAIRLASGMDPAYVARGRFALARALYAAAADRDRDRDRALDLAREAHRTFLELDRSEAAETADWLAARGGV